MIKLKILTVLFISFIFFSCSNTEQKGETDNSIQIENPTNKVKLSSEIDWEQLNPARGDKSPQAGTVWGDRKGQVATGFLAKFVDGFSSPPHIHNVTYRAVVIKGLIHNDDPDAENMWMPPGSFWTQPMGESHITSAKGEENMAYVEIDSGPYLVKPTSEAFDNGERPVNIDKSNIIWLNASETDWVESSSDAEVSFLWERKDETQLRGLFIKMPPGSKEELHSDGSICHAIIIEGLVSYQMPDSQLHQLDPASYFGSEGKSIHAVTNGQTEDAVIYVRTNGKIKVY
ncbi:MAG: DUF4437 domain-containing protein [Bacteroidota bacterium]